MFSLEKLADFLNLQAITGWSSGDWRKGKKSKYDFSRLNYEPIINEAYSLDEKLALLLNDLEKDRAGVLNLTKNTNAIISVCRYQYIDANAGISFDIAMIKRLELLNLGIDIDTYIIGKR